MFRRIAFRRIALPLLLLSTLVLAACAPRGETRTLEEIYDSSKARFEQSVSNASSTQLNQELNQLAEKVIGFQKDETIEIARDISEQLLALTSQAGFTSRPALTEIQKQYLFISQLSSADNLSEAQKKLLAARTFSILAQEMETTGFRV